MTGSPETEHPLGSRENPQPILVVLCRVEGCEEVGWHRISMQAQVPVYSHTGQHAALVDVEMPICAFHKGWLMDEAIKNLSFRGPKPKRGV